MDRRTFLSALALTVCSGCVSHANQLTVGSKNFTEQLILGEILKQSLERACRMPVDGRFYLAGTYICQQAILSGRIDTYVEYTGTALGAILKQTFSGSSQAAYELVKSEYKRRFNLDVMLAARIQQFLCHGHARRAGSADGRIEVIAARAAV